MASRSGTKWTDADYRAAGWVKRTLRFRAETDRDLRLVARPGEGMAETISRLVAQERRRQTRHARRRSVKAARAGTKESP